MIFTPHGVLNLTRRGPLLLCCWFCRRAQAGSFRADTKNDMLRSETFRALFQKLNLDTLSQSGFNSNSASRWHGLGRYNQQQERLEGELLHEQEYGKWTTLLDTEALEVTYYADVPGAYIGMS